MTQDDRGDLRARTSQLEKQLAAANQKIAQLQRDRTASEVADGAVGITEFEDTLKRLVQRVAMILQAEKCAIMIRDRESGELIARNPAFGMTDADVQSLRIKIDEGVAGDVFRTEEPAIFHDALNDPRTVKSHVGRLNIRNGVVVPLVVEKRDENNRVEDR